MPVYYAVIGDLIRSKSIQDRGKAQDVLEEVIASINARYHNDLASKFTITLGDEFQGVLKHPAHLFQLLDDLEIQLMDYPCRFGIGCGTIATRLNPEISLGADGEAYWRARQALNEVHENHDYEMTRTRLISASSADVTRNDLLSLSDAIKRRWSDLQRSTFKALLEQGIYRDQFDQKQFAQTLGISPETLYKRLKNSSIKTYLRSRSNLQQTMEAEYESQR